MGTESSRTMEKGESSLKLGTQRTNYTVDDSKIHFLSELYVRQFPDRKSQTNFMWTFNVRIVLLFFEFTGVYDVELHHLPDVRFPCTSIRRRRGSGETRICLSLE